MTPFGISLIAVMATGFLPWTYVFGGRNRAIKAVAIALLALDTVVYYYLFFQFSSIERGLAMNVFLLASVHLLTIAMSGLVWGIFGQALMRLFLATPLFVLLLLLVGRLYALNLALTFTP